MTLNPTLRQITDRIIKRSEKSRAIYLDRMGNAARKGPSRAHLSCSNHAHAFAAMGQDKDTLTGDRAANLGIITAFNDMLSAHKPYEQYPEMIRQAAREAGATASGRRHSKSIGMPRRT